MSFMFDYQLFLGFFLSPLYQSQMAQLPQPVRSLFIDNQDPQYLQEIEYEGCRYLGKYIGSVVELNALDIFQAHIYSLLKRLVPLYPYEKNSLVLIAISKSSLKEIAIEDKGLERKGS